MPATPATPVVAWLLDADPSLRWQVLRDLTDGLAEAVSRLIPYGIGHHVWGVER